MRICGRVLRPSNLAERRLLLGHFGVHTIRVPRSQNPFAIARRIRRLLSSAEFALLRELARHSVEATSVPDAEDDEDVSAC